HRPPRNGHRDRRGERDLGEAESDRHTQRRVRCGRTRCAERVRTGDFPSVGRDGGCDDRTPRRGDRRSVHQDGRGRRRAHSQAERTTTNRGNCMSDNEEGLDAAETEIEEEPTGEAGADPAEDPDMDVRDESSDESPAETELETETEDDGPAFDEDVMADEEADLLIPV